MKRGRRLGILLLGIAVFVGLAAWVASIALRPKFPTPAAITASMRRQAALTGGAQVYVTHCAYCHDTGFGPSIAGRNFPSQAVASWVRSGPAAMQSFTLAQVSDADIEAVTHYVNELPMVPEKKP